MSEKIINFSLEVVAPPGWFLSIAPLALRVVKGDPASFSVTASAKGGYVSDLSLSILGLPAGVEATITPDVIPQDGTAVITIPTDDIPEDTILNLQLKVVGA